VDAGHRSIVVARQDSRVAGALVPIADAGEPLTDEAQRRTWAACREAVRHAIDHGPVDVVHFHSLHFHRCLPPAGPPVLATLHLPPEWYGPEAFHLSRPETYLHCVSATQRGACPPGVPMLPQVPNGVDVDAFPARVRRRDFVLALGRICPEKGYHLALDAARRAGVPLVIGGQVFPYDEHVRYFRDELRPRLRGAALFAGAMGFRRKRRALSAARCLLVPSLVPETSSLVAMEALACGTPVIAYPKGALPSIVDHGRTGFLVNDVDGMVDAIRAVGRLDPGECRRAARERFSSDRMVELYFETYRLLADPERLAASREYGACHAA
jgi:glycosyltransferase involved in cell wall biosynthesis